MYVSLVYMMSLESRSLKVFTQHVADFTLGS